MLEADDGVIVTHSWSSYNFVNDSLIPYTRSITIYSYEIGRLLEGQTTGLYAIFGTIIAVVLLSLRRKVDKKAGILLILIYLLSYFTATL